MAILFKIILVILCSLMFIVHTEKKIIIFVFSLICFSAVSIVNSKIGSLSVILPCCFFISELFSYKKKVKNRTLHLLMFITLISILILFTHSSHYTGINGFTKLLMYEFFSKNFVLVIGTIAICKKTNFVHFFNTIFYATLILTFFSILNIIIGRSLWLEMLDISFNFLDMERFRIQSMFMYPFDYGYMCILILIISYYGYKKEFLVKKKFTIILYCTLIGILFGGCRTITVCAIVAFLVYILITYKLWKSMKYLILLGIFFIMGYNLIPPIKEKTDFILTAFDKNHSALGSSSLGMREEQLNSVLLYIASNPLYGRGYDFFYRDLNWADGHEGALDNSLQGLEGVHLSYLLERGIVGYGFYLLFYAILLTYLWKKRKKNKFTSSIAITIIMTYLLFSHMTGELKSLLPTLFFIGILIKTIDLEDNETSCNNYTSV